jgi:hypothetical protein
MKKNILALCLVYCFAQSNAQQKTTWYDQFTFAIENDLFVQVHSEIKNHPVSFYTQEDGGKIITKTELNEHGECLVSFKHNSLPNFLLIDKMTSTIGEPEFSLKHFEINESGENHLISFDAMVSASAQSETYFELIRTEGKYQSTMMMFDNLSNSQFQKYEYVESEKGMFQYQIVVKHKNKGTRYESQHLMLNNPSKILVYPTIVNDFLHVVLPISNSCNELSIFDMNHCLIKKIPVLRLKFDIELATLSSGSYLICESGNPTLQLARFTKL